MAGFVAACVFRLNVIVVSPALEYVRVGSFVSISPERDGFASSSGLHLLTGTSVIGHGGFPVSTFVDCRLYGIENEIAPRPLHVRCPVIAPFGDGSVIINTAFWGAVFFVSYLVVMHLWKKFIASTPTRS